jgi:hypothetical protein
MHPMYKFTSCHCVCISQQQSLAIFVSHANKRNFTSFNYINCAGHNCVHSSHAISLSPPNHSLPAVGVGVTFGILPTHRSQLNTTYF